jgi:hypothetical protein
MNYIAEIKAFYDWLECNSLEATHISLWHGLMSIANKSGWREEFNVPMSTLESKTGIKRSNLYKARNKLKQAGLIDFRERDGRQSTLYKMLPLCPCGGRNSNVPVTDEQHTGNAPVTDEYSIHKLNINETKQEDVKKDDFVIQKKFGNIIGAWNSLKLQELKIIQGTREELLGARIKQYGEDAVVEAIENIRKSSFLRGQSKGGFVITFDWLIRPNNFPKVLEGNYSDKEGGTQNGGNSGNTDGDARGEHAGQAGGGAGKPAGKPEKDLHGEDD